MTDDEKAATERVRRLESPQNMTPADFDETYGKAGGFRHDVDDDYRTLARAFLREHPGDEDVGVDEAWLSSTFGRLASCGRKRYALHFATRLGLVLSWCPPCGDLPACLCIETAVIVTAPTRGDVRRLCKCLGVPITEQPNG